MVFLVLNYSLHLKAQRFKEILIEILTFLQLKMAIMVMLSRQSAAIKASSNRIMPIINKRAKKQQVNYINLIYLRTF